MNILSGDLNETAAAKSTTDGSIFVGGTAANTIVERIPTNATIVTSQSTTSTTYTNLATTGPQVTVSLTAKALVSLYCRMQNATAGQSNYVGYDISAPSSLVADDTRAMEYVSVNATHRQRMSLILMNAGLTAGSHTFTMQYRVDAGTATFQDRRMFIVPF